jgi:hypothetical protein
MKRSLQLTALVALLLCLPVLATPTLAAWAECPWDGPELDCTPYNSSSCTYQWNCTSRCCEAASTSAECPKVCL